MLGIIQLLANVSNLDYLGFYEGIIDLESKMGSLPIFYIPDYFSDQEKQDLLLYRLNSTIPKPSDILTQMRGVTSATESDNELWQRILSKIKLPFKTNVSQYLEYFELIFGNLIDPLFERKQNLPISQRIRRSRPSYNDRLKWFKQQLNKHNIDPKIERLLDYLDGTLRNAFVHSKYFLKEDILHYYWDNPVRKTYRFYQKPLREFEKELGLIVIQRMIFQTLIGLRLSGQQPDDLRKIIIVRKTHSKGDKCHPNEM